MNNDDSDGKDITEVPVLHEEHSDNVNLSDSLDTDHLFQEIEQFINSTPKDTQKALHAYQDSVRKKMDAAYEGELSPAAQLARDNPEEFQRQATKILDDFVSSAPTEQLQARLFALRQTIDRELSRFKDPLARFNKMVELFYQGVGQFQDVLEEKSDSQSMKLGKEYLMSILKKKPEIASGQSSADVITFSGSKDKKGNQE